MGAVKVAIDPRWTGGGIGRFYREVVGRIGSGALELHTLNIQAALANPFSPVAIGKAVRSSTCDLFWSPGFMPPLGGGVPFVITIHDLIHRDHADAARRIYYDRCIRPIALRARAIITVSNYSRDQIIGWLGKNAPEVRVVANGVSDAFSPLGERLLLDRQYFLYVGNQRTHKNVYRMMEAFAASKASAHVRLVLTGQATTETMATVRRLSLHEKITFLGEVDEGRLAAAYRGAIGVIQVSLSEGFGLPVVEAMASGTPVICSSTTALGEVAGDAALLVAPDSTEQISRAMDRLWSEQTEGERLRELGLRRSNAFSWDEVARQTGALLRSFKE